jgi:hypothetical protein
MNHLSFHLFHRLPVSGALVSSAVREIAASLFLSNFGNEACQTSGMIHTRTSRRAGRTSRGQWRK